jgi:hypothetical protein
LSRRRHTEKKLQERTELKREILLLSLTSLLFVGHATAEGLAAEKKDAISKIMLTPASLPPGATVARELSASESQLIRVRTRIGFPLNALLNQTIIYENEQARVNYMVPSHEEWLDFAYSKLIRMDGERSFILSKGGVVVQIAATTREFEEKVARALKADILHYRKIKTGRLPEDWDLINERYLSREEVREVEQEIGGRVQSALMQEFIVERKEIRVEYYRWGSQREAESFTRHISHEKGGILMRQVESSGSVVVVVDSQIRELNERAMALVNW